MTESIITTLAKIPDLFIIDRNSTFKHKGKVVSAKQVAEELSVRHVLTGSMQKNEQQIRIHVQLY